MTTELIGDCQNLGFTKYLPSTDPITKTLLQIGFQIKKFSLFFIGLPKILKYCQHNKDFELVFQAIQVELLHNFVQIKHIY